MKKIPTMFERDWDGDRSRVLDKPHPDCGWVFDGEGVATRKLDGTSCLVRAGKLYKRRELRAGQIIPHDFEIVETDEETGKTVGWVPVGDGPEDRWHREAVASLPIVDGTYELVGPKIQGNPEGYPLHALVRHNTLLIDAYIERTFAGIRAFLEANDFEGIVFHHFDGRMAKIKKRDFGLKR